MKLELLLEREPIGRLTAQTLSQVWGTRYGTPFSVQWQARGTTIRRQASGSQNWVCNAPFNVIFLPDSPGSQLEPIHREFGRSLVRWRQPLQTAYLRLALSSQLAHTFRCANLVVTPDVPDGHNWIIIPGNQKLRLLNRTEEICLVAAKHGFPREAILRELNAGARAQALGLPVVPVLETGGNGSWYLETYVSATPLNRLTNPGQARQIAGRALKHLRRFVEDAIEFRSAADYAGQLATQLHDLMQAVNLRERFGLGQVSDVIQQLVQLTRRSTWPLPIGQTHGDFQPANILVDDGTFWIIDWELSSRRQAAYDPLVFFLAARFPRGLANRMQSLMGAGPLLNPIEAYVTSEYDWRARQRQRTYLAIFLLEEFQWRLEQLAPSVITATGGGTEQFLTEANLWTRQQLVR